MSDQFLEPELSAALNRRSLVFHTKLAGHMARVAAARRSESGVQILTMSQLAARLAGGFLQPIDPDALLEAVRGALSETKLGDLDDIKHLPGMARAAVATLDKVWRAGLELSVSPNPRLQALSKLESAALERLPPSMLRPEELVERAQARIGLAPKVLGPIEVHGHSEMSPCWRPLLSALADVTPVTWIAGVRSVPDWIDRAKITVERESRSVAQIELFSCATPNHEALEALRWARGLIASGAARPDQIAIAAASPGEFDDHMAALAADANIPVHFVHGIRAVTTRDGQAVAALAEALTKGISQERVRRLFALLQKSSPALAGLQPEWTRVLPKDAPLTTVDRWWQVFARLAPDAWPDGVDQSKLVLGVLELLDKGSAAAEEAGASLLTDRALALWKRALADGPAAALPVTLGGLRVDDGLEPAAHIIWTSAISLASAPRPFVRLLALNSGRWPRRISEDRLIPDHIIPLEELDPLPIADGDRRDFETIIASATSAGVSFSRRDVGGRMLGRSPLVTSFTEIYLSRGRTPEHAASESDRILARPNEFRTTPIAVSGQACWRDWTSREITAHDGLVGDGNVRLKQLFEAPLSATSLRLLLRDPLRFAWRYALGWKQPDESDEPLTLDPLAFGNLIHAALQKAVDDLEDAGGFAHASDADKLNAVKTAVENVARDWETEQPVPPPVIWRATLERAVEVSSTALLYPLDPLPGQKSWTEVSFGMIGSNEHRNGPWDAGKPVEVPGAGVKIQGHIDRLDLAADEKCARVIDYKTGLPGSKLAERQLHGGTELQRCLYAFAVQALLGSETDVEAALLYPRAGAENQALYPLTDVKTSLDILSKSIRVARETVEAGLTLPGVDAADPNNDFAFALPAGPGYLARKLPVAQTRLGEATEIWEAE